MLRSKLAHLFANPLVGAVLTATIVVTLVGCDYGKSEYEAFEGSKVQDCEVGLASFKTNIAGSIGGCSCHLGSQSPRFAKNADGDNRKALLTTKQDYAYLSTNGRHQGAAAFRSGISEAQWDAWQADEKKCP